MIKLELDYIPPSSNNAYFNLPRGGRALTSAGKSFKVNTKAILARTFPTELQYFKPNEPYLIVIRLTFETLQNKTWGVKNGTDTRYKKSDATNRIKLLEDAIKDVTGVDDSCTMTFIVQKVEGPKEKTEIFIWATDREETPFDEPIRRL